MTTPVLLAPPTPIAIRRGAMQQRGEPDSTAIVTNEDAKS
jgi:hypothetical protein